MTDNDYLLNILSDGEWHGRDDIIGYSFFDRGCGLTVHSRAADLRAKGHIIECKTGPGKRRQSFYRLVAPLEAAA